MKNTYLTILMALSLSISGFAQQTYYNDVDLTLTGTALRDELATKVINTHTNFISYTQLWEASRVTDLDPNDPTNTNILLVYGWENGTDADVTNDLARNKNSNGGATGDWNREHVYARSLGTPNLGTSGPGSDAHHLRPADVQRNGSRGNRKFADGTGNSGTVGADWYPGDATAGGTDWRGDVARMMMYTYIRYGNQCLPSNVVTGTTNAVDSNMINLLLDWNAADPVSQLEIQRNDIWGIFGGSNDTEAPTVPTNLVASNPTSSTVDLAWTASTDNTAVTSYDVYVNGSFYVSTNSSATSYTVTGLTPETNYTFEILAKDAANNMSALSTSTSSTTLAGPPAGSDCVAETFENIPTSSPSSYAARTWTGDDGGTWNATDARTDQTIVTKAITIRNGSLTSPAISGGIGDLTVTTKRVFGGSSGTFNVTVNGTLVGTIPYSDIEETTTIPSINVEGAITVVFNSNSVTSNRVSIDELTWTCYSSETLSLDNFSLNNLQIFPNPIVNNKLTVKTTKDLTYVIYDVLGKEIKKGIITRTNNVY